MTEIRPPVATNVENRNYYIWSAFAFCASTQGRVWPVGQRKCEAMYLKLLGMQKLASFTIVKNKLTNQFIHCYYSSFQ
jgi:hypothetical protein